MGRGWPDTTGVPPHVRGGWVRLRKLKKKIHTPLPIACGVRPNVVYFFFDFSILYFLLHCDSGLATALLGRAHQQQSAPQRRIGDWRADLLCAGPQSKYQVWHR